MELVIVTVAVVGLALAYRAVEWVWRRRVLRRAAVRILPAGTGSRTSPAVARTGGGFLIYGPVESTSPAENVTSR